MNIYQLIDRIYPIPETSKLKFVECIREVKFPKQHILLRADKVENKVYFIKSGIVRAYSTYDGTEITFWFGKEGETIISMKSYVEQKPSYEYIELLEKCELYEMKTENLKALFNQDIHVANWGRVFAEKELIKTEERLISRQFRTASERYFELIKENPDLIQRVKLGHLASYLGITQVSLSRIRAEIK